MLTFEIKNFNDKKKFTLHFENEAIYNSFVAEKFLQQKRNLKENSFTVILEKDEIISLIEQLRKKQHGDQSQLVNNNDIFTLRPLLTLAEKKSFHYLSLAFKENESFEFLLSKSHVTSFVKALELVLKKMHGIKIKDYYKENYFSYDKVLNDF